MNWASSIASPRYALFCIFASMSTSRSVYVLFMWPTGQKMKFSIKYFFSKCDQIRRKLWIWSHLLKKSLIENFIFCAVIYFSIIVFIFITINHIVPLKQTNFFFKHACQKFRLRLFLSFCLVFSQLWLGVAYESVAYKKACVSFYISKIS